MKQTAVQWLIDELFNESTVVVTKENNPTLFEVLEQAKEMELEKLKEAYSMGRLNKSIKEFNETFKSE